MILLAHGAGDPRWADPVRAVAARAASLAPGLAVRCAFLERMAPDLTGAIGEVVLLGSRRIAVVPLFFGQGKHLREDLPRQLEHARTRHPDCEITLAPTLGEAPEVIELLAQLAVHFSNRAAHLP